MSGEILGHNGRDPSVYKTNLVTCCHLSVFFAKLGEYSLNSSKWVGKFPEVLDLNWLFLKLLTGSSATTGGFSPVIGWDGKVYYSDMKVLF